MEKTVTITLKEYEHLKKLESEFTWGFHEVKSSFGESISYYSKDEITNLYLDENEKIEKEYNDKVRKYDTLSLDVHRHNTSNIFKRMRKIKI